jgi:hypothetical protein
MVGFDAKDLVIRVRLGKPAIEQQRQERDVGVDDINVDVAALGLDDQPFDGRSGKDLEGFNDNAGIFLVELCSDLLVQADVERGPDHDVALAPRRLVDRLGGVIGPGRAGDQQAQRGSGDAKQNKSGA